MLTVKHTTSNTQTEQVSKKDVLAGKTRIKVVDELITAVSSVQPKLHVNVTRK
jgi:hypothetical protein